MAAMATSSWRWRQVVHPCPFLQVGNSACLASQSRQGWEDSASPRCRTETHEECPLYLSKVLRGSRPIPVRWDGDLPLK